MTLHIEFDRGGKEVIERIVKAYGFTTRLALAEHFGISSSSMSMRYKRDFFPADIAIRCMAETGVKLEWLATGKGKMHDDGRLDVLELPSKKLVDGEVFEAANLVLDKNFFPAHQQPPIKPEIVYDASNQYVVETEFKEVYDGKWLVNIEGKTNIRDLTRIPVNKVRVTGAGVPFDCGIDEIGILGRIISKIEYF